MSVSKSIHFWTLYYDLNISERNHQVLRYNPNSLDDIDAHSVCVPEVQSVHFNQRKK